MRYHPFEIGVVGYSGSGKTTLISRLLERMSGRYDIGYYKHDAHKFFMDKSGKDTHTARESGAESIYINDPRHSAFIRSGEPSPDLLRAMFSDMDLLFVEGRKRSPIPKLLLLDPRGEAQELFASPAPPENLLAILGPGAPPECIPANVPYLQRDDLAGVEAAVEDELRRRIRKQRLKALVLVGGRSSRMGEPKAFLRYRGEREVDRLVRIAEELVEEVYVSCRREQLEDPGLQGFNLLPDRFVDVGPMGGLLTAMHQDPEAAWLVLSCDLPFLNRDAVETLVRRRNPFRVATSFLEPENELPEPLIAIWEPKARGYLHRYLGELRAGPRKLLIDAPIEGILPEDPDTLRSINRPEERDAAVAELSALPSGPPFDWSRGPL